MPGFDALLLRFERSISVLARSPKTFENYARHVAAIALHYGKLPTDLDQEQVHDYLFSLQKRSKTPSETYFKHTVYGLRFMLKTEGLPYEYLHLPEIKKVNKLPEVLSLDEVWAMLMGCTLLKHKILIGLLYGCGLRCMEVRNLKLVDMNFDRMQLKVVQGKNKKDRYLPLSAHLVRGIKTYISVENPYVYLFENQLKGGEITKDFDSRYSQKGVQWAVKESAKRAGITKNVYTHMLRHTYATHLLEAGLNIVSLQHLLGHQNIETTMIYLQVAQLDNSKVFSPLDTLFTKCRYEKCQPK